MEAYRSDESWSALGDPMRRTIVERLSAHPYAVGELAAVLPISRPAVSQHLKILKNAGLVDESPVGTRRIYRLNPAAVLAMRDQLDTYWSRALLNYRDVVEREQSSASGSSASRDLEEKEEMP